MNTFESLLAGLARADVDFIVVGGLAVAMAGYPRATDDLDILVSTDEANLSRLLGVLENFGEGSAKALSPNDFPLEEGCVRVAEAFDVDLFTQMSGLTYQDLLPMTFETLVAGQPVRYLGAGGLLKLKSDSLRPKDQLDAQVLREILNRSKAK